MRDRWHFRRAHARRLRTGRTIFVCGGWVLQGECVSGNGTSFKRACPVCGALIVSVGMPKGGWVHFEGGEGLTQIKPVSYTHLDVYKRQKVNWAIAGRGWKKRSRC